MPRRVDPAAAPPEEPLPTDLPDRAEMFARAEVCNDTRTMRRFAAPGDERAVFAWSARHRAPAALRPRRARPSRRKSTAELVLPWKERGDAWCFIAPPR
ncbi:MAG TPA: hypothetical protein VH092_10865 [Urbifossiella sp.]|nr:hypothetical protein [Urbifossiella sp.]